MKVAPSEEAAGPLEIQITELWLRQGSPAVSLLMARGLRPSVILEFKIRIRFSAAMR